MKREKIEKMIGIAAGKDEIFLVDIVMKPAGSIRIFVDSLNGIGIDECAKIHRSLKELAGEELDEYNVTVSSPGLDMPLKVPEQYRKAVGKSVEILMKNGLKKTGILRSFESNSITIEETVKKEPKLEIYSLEEIKSTKFLIKF